MEIARVDPYLVRWAASGAIALATESIGIQISYLDAKELLAHKVKWMSSRHTPPHGGRVIDMQWGPTLQSSEASCFLAYILDTGECNLVEVVNDEIRLRQSFLGTFSAVTWQGPTLLLGSIDGEIAKYDVPSLKRLSKLAALNSKVVHLVESNGALGALTNTNECWLKQNNGDWENLPLTESSYVSSILFIGSELVVCQPGQIQVGNTISSLQSFLPCDAIIHNGKAAFVHSDGTVSNLGNLQLPKFEGDMVGSQSHPTLSLAIVVLGERSSGSHLWEFPILSGRSVKFAIFPLSKHLEIPRRRQVDAPIAWLSAISKQSTLLPPNSCLDNPELESSSKNTQLVDALRNLFLNDWFDDARWRWYANEQNRTTIEKEMKSAIYQIIRKMKPLSIADRLVCSFYSDEPFENFQMHGELVDDAFSPQTPGSTSFLKSSGGGVLCAGSGRKWKRCALTGLPLMTPDILTSSDGSFLRSCTVSVLNGSSDSTKNEISSALLEAANFCVFTGCSWRKN